MKTFSAKPAEVTHEWFVIDATDKVLGRVASEVALRLRGKHKAIYTPHVDTGDFIVVVNADKIRVTGNKANDKIYYRHTGYPGGIYGTSFKDMQAKHPGRALEKAVTGMLPKGPLGYAMVGGLIVSQALTLFTTPVIYIYLDRLSNYLLRWLSLGAVEEAAERPSTAAE